MAERETLEGGRVPNFNLPSIQRRAKFELNDPNESSGSSDSSGSDASPKGGERSRARTMSEPSRGVNGADDRYRKPTVFVDNPQALLQELFTSRQAAGSFDRGSGSVDLISSGRISEATPVAAPSSPSKGPAILPKAKEDSKKEKENIKVAVRIRPKIARDAHQPDVVNVCRDGCSISFSPGAEASSNQRSSGSGGRVYTYDFVFDSRPNAKNVASQTRIYKDLGDRIVRAAVDGYNSCLFAYGQTGTGKTHTVVGRTGAGSSIQDHEERGVLPRILEGIFAEVERRRKEGRTLVLKISFLEIYNEMIHDLLVPPARGPQKEQSLTIRYTPGLGLIINDLSELVADTFEEACESVAFGMKMRSIAATSMNSRSSRAHTVFTFRMEQGDEVGNVKMAQVQIIDLAGREQEKTSGDDRERLRERAFINKSLFYLSTCISNLSRNTAGKIPEWTYRNSKLTMVLTNSLGKNSKTAMIAAVSPTLADIDETISTLRFASQVKLITNEASCNTVNKRDLVSELQSEILRLKEEQGAIANRDLQEQVTQLEALCENYRASLQHEKSRSEELRAKRKECLIEMGLSVGDNSSSISVKLEQEVPYLVNLSEDPFLEGCLMYFLKKSENTSIGSADDNNIKLVGLGVLPHHCIIRNEENERLELHLAESTGLGGDKIVPRTFLNGRRVVDTRRMKHKDRLILGHAFAFKVHLPLTSLRRKSNEKNRFAPDSPMISMNGSLLGTPSPTSATTSPGGAPSLESEEGLTQALAEVQMEDQNQEAVRFFCEHYTEHLSPEASSAFTGEVHSAMMLVEEANMISREVRPEENLAFRLQVLIDVLSSPMPSEAPALVVAVMTMRDPVKEGSVPGSTRRSEVQAEEERQRPLRPGSMDSDRQVSGERSASKDSDMLKAVLKFVWSFDKFRSRLQSMRDIYEESQRKGVEACRRNLRREPYSDPWKEIGNGEVQMLLDGLGPGGASTAPTASRTASTVGSGSGSDESDDETKETTYPVSSEDENQMETLHTAGSDRSEGEDDDYDARSRARSRTDLSDPETPVMFRRRRTRAISDSTPDLRVSRRRGCAVQRFGISGGKTERTWFDIGRRSRQHLFRTHTAVAFEDAERLPARTRFMLAQSSFNLDNVGAFAQRGPAVAQRLSVPNGHVGLATLEGSCVQHHQGFRSAAFVDRRPAPISCVRTDDSLRIWKAPDEISPVGEVALVEEVRERMRSWTEKLHAKEAERAAKRQLWSVQIQAPDELSPVGEVSPITEGRARMRSWSDKLQAKEAERTTKMQSWSAQIQAKEDVLQQLKDNLSQLRALETPQSPVKLSTQSSPVDPRSAHSSPLSPLRSTLSPSSLGLLRSTPLSSGLNAAAVAHAAPETRRPPSPLRESSAGIWRRDFEL